MSVIIPPSPVGSPFGSYVWADWYEKVRRAINNASGTVVPATLGGTGFTSYTVGDMLYANTTTTLTKLNVSTNGKVLTLAGGVPTWATPAASTTFSVWNPFDMGTNICSAAATGDGCSQLCVGSNGSFCESCRGTKSLVVGAADVMFEVKIVGSPGVGLAGPTAWGLGVGTSAATLINYPGRDAFSWAYYNSGVKENNNVAPAYGATYANGDIIGVRVDTSGNLIFYKNGTSQGTAYTIAASTVIFPFAGSGSTAGDRGFVLNTGGKAFINPVGGVAAWG